jgi:peptidoglycan/xylan/chitin deacetylase (PgdA/CDA1 family)
VRLAVRSLDRAQRYLPRSRSGTAVLAYHLVGAGTQAVVDLPLDVFRRQLDWLKDTCDVVSLDEALDAPQAPGLRAVLTFDDAYRNFLERAWPELQARQMPAILYVPVGFVRGTSPSPLRGAELAPLSFKELRELAEAGLHIGSHSLSHRNLRRLPPSQVERELGESREQLEQELAIKIDSFCYPQAKLTPGVARLTARHYRSAVTGGGRPFRGGSLLTIPRFPLRRDQHLFEQMVQSRIWLSEAVAHQLRQFRA